ncbi:uncharacterized protein N0V89_009003 [Didymosphaeria variabile]|uniref:Uncharacterized protein n=1 Tax=Didymosphaeria variabile TaxID=1932322 RepID=A0A9W8XHU4_9PLEO|nr:uncharacterized protein N0V89_009003 [Didymosphaeria variabile]KAJ4350382.1 hypothetical protein N0V89_009003 [Didymosphaeria variabile]
MVDLSGPGNWISAPSQSIVDNIPVEERFVLKDILEHKLQGIPADLVPLPRSLAQKKAGTGDDSFETEHFHRYLTITQVLDHEPNAINLPHIPSDLRLEFLLRNRVTIDAHCRLAIKDSEEQHVDITRAIYFWRLDGLHQFQRYHDSARWNIALYVALLTDDLSDNSGYVKTKAAHEFAIAYLAAVLEHHNDAAVFEKREAFIKMWKSTQYDFFIFNSSQKRLMKNEMKRLAKEWQVELQRIQKGKELGKNNFVRENNYNAKIAKFVGVLIPGDQSQRGPNHRTPTETIEELKTQNDFGAADMKKGALLKALKDRSSYYHVPKPAAKPKVKLDPPQIPMDDGVLGFPIEDAAFLEAQKPKPEPASTDWPALHFPKLSHRVDVNQHVEDVVDQYAAIRILKQSKPRAMLAKLMDLFPEEFPIQEPSTADAAASPPQLLPSAALKSAPVMPPTFEDLGAWVASNVVCHRANDADGRIPSINTSSISQDNLQTTSAKRIREGDSREMDEPNEKRTKSEEESVARPARSLFLPVDESLLHPQTTWQIPADLPATASTTPLSGGDKQKPSKPLFGGRD